MKVEEEDTSEVIYNTYTLNEIKGFFYEFFGRVKEVAQKMQCSRAKVYFILEDYPEIAEAKEKASRFYRSEKVETAEEVHAKLMVKAEEDPTNALRAAQYILNKSKESPYFAEVKTNEAYNFELLNEVIGDMQEVPRVKESTESGMENK